MNRYLILPNQKKKFSHNFRRSESKPKWLVRKLLLDTKLIGGTVGKIIAYAANKENPHYKTISSHILANTLGPLVFPGGNKKPILKKRGTILIDSILHKQYKAMRVFEKNYTRDENTINFMDKEVEMELNGQKIKLDTITASNNLETDEEDKKLYVVYFNGNSGCYQQDYKMVAEDLIAYKNKGYNATAVQFNYPGVLGNGQVNKAQQLVDAGIAQVKKLLDDGVPHNQIILHGESLGGSIATHVAAHFHKLAKTDDQTQRQTLGGVYASKTFASTAQVGRDFFNRALGDNIFSRTVSTLCLPFIKLGTWGSEWDLDTGAKFFSLPRNKRNYSVVLSPHTVRQQYRENYTDNSIKKVADRLIGKRVCPADDEILRRGLHGSWEKKVDSFLAKRGYYGEDVKQNYSKENQRRKMMVVNFKTSKPTVEGCSRIDGHAKANHCFFDNKANTHKRHDKNKNHYGLVHLTKETRNGVSKITLAPKNSNNESSEVARQSIIAMRSQQP